MKTFVIFRNILLLAIVSTIMAFSCDSPTPAKTAAQKLAQSWKLSKVTKGTTAEALSLYSSYRVVYTQTAGQNSGTYVVTKGGAPVSISKQTSGTGQWALSINESAGTGTLTLDGSRVLNISNFSDKTMTVSWKLDIDEDKTQPTYIFEFVPAQ